MQSEIVSSTNSGDAVALLGGGKLAIGVCLAGRFSHADQLEQPLCIANTVTDADTVSDAKPDSAAVRKQDQYF